MKSPEAPLDVVFLGPTLPANEAGRLLPGADVRGPIAVGDVLRLVDDHVARRVRVGRIAIIDGYFERMAAVWHKEILLALEAGIEVWGAASMGALRAAELAAFGMRGVGTIFERFASGELVADDEVAVAHLPAEYGYRATSVALVDLRDGIAQLCGAMMEASDRDARAEASDRNARAEASDRDARVEASDRDARAEASDRDGLIDANEHARLVELARAPFYRERSWERLLADAKGAGLSSRTIAAVSAAVHTAHRTAEPRTSPGARSVALVSSRKAADARLLLETMARTTRTPPKGMPVPRTWALARLREALE